MPAIDPPPCTVCGSYQVLHFATVDARQYWRCRICSLTFLDPSQWVPKNEEKACYDRHENSPHDPAYRAFLSQLIQPLVPKLTPGTIGLDYGCGPGPTLSVMLQEQGFKMVIYDPYFADDNKVLLRQYAFITCTEVAEHFYHPYREFSRLDGLLLPEGWLGVMTSFLEKDTVFRDWYYRRDPTHVVFYKRQTLVWIARHFGWRVEFPGQNIALFQKIEREPVLTPLGAMNTKRGSRIGIQPTGCNRLFALLA